MAEDVFVSANQFVNLKFETPDQASKKLKTLKIFQKLLTLHQANGPKAPYVDVELARLEIFKKPCERRE